MADKPDPDRPAEFKPGTSPSYAPDSVDVSFEHDRNVGGLPREESAGAAESHISLACIDGALTWPHRGRVEECIDCIAHTEAAKVRTWLALKGSPESDVPTFSPWERLLEVIETLEHMNDAKTLQIQQLNDALGKTPLLIPTNWCDPLLTGEDALLGKPPFNNGTIEQLFLALRERLRDHVFASRILAVVEPEPVADPTPEERAGVHLGGDKCPHIFVGGGKRSGFLCDACTVQLIRDVERAATRAAISKIYAAAAEIS